MFTVRSSHGRPLYSPLLLIYKRLLSSTTCRRAAAAAPSNSAIFEPHGPVAEKLAATGVWAPNKRNTRARVAATPVKKRSTKKASTPNGDKSRVNIVSDKLCDDILSYIGPSLERHRGCDIVDLYPGAGEWSSKLNQFLQPRSHVLLEPDADLYRPFLQPLLDQPGTTLLPAAGIIWRELASVLMPEVLPHQTIPDDPNTRNDTLLVTANLCFHPKKRFLRFDSIAVLVLHQLIDAVRMSALFQRYGLVRMLVWTSPDDKSSFLPKLIQKRRRQAIENDFSLEWIREVCGKETVSEYHVRDDLIDRASLAATIERMRAANLEMPAGRESAAFREGLKRGQVPMPGTHPPTFTRHYHHTLSDLTATNAKQGGLDEESDEFKTMKLYAWRAQTDIRKAERFHYHTTGLDNILALRVSKRATPEEIAAVEKEWQRGIRELPKTIQYEFQTYKDNLFAFRRSPPLLQWDRRPYEPLTVQPEEFFPRVECCLLDIQPRAPHPLLRQSGPGSTRSADIFDIVMGTLMHHPTHPLGPSLDALWPGAADYILPRWKSGQDLSRGGLPLHLRGAELGPRSLDAQQWEELFELWMEWPFRPEFHDLVGRAHDNMGAEDEEGLPAEI